MATISVCASCRASKRRCDGMVPCKRCTARGEADECVKPVPKKRGRPRKVVRGLLDGRAQKESKQQEGVAIEWTPVVLPDVDYVDQGDEDDEGEGDSSAEVTQLLAPDGSPLLSLLIQFHTTSLTADRPRDLAMAMGTRMSPNFLLFECAQLVDASGRYDPVRSMLAARVVAAGADGTLPQWSNDPHGAYFAGRTMGDLTYAPPTKARMRLFHRMSSPSGTGRPVMRSVALEKSTPQYNERGRPVTLRLRATSCMDANARFVWLYLALEGASYLPPPLPELLPLPPELALSPPPPPSASLLHSLWASPPPSPGYGDGVFDLGPW